MKTNEQLIKANKKYKLARAEYLNLIEGEDFRFEVSFLDKTRRLLHNAAYSALKELNAEYIKVFKRPFISKDEWQREGDQLVYRIKGAPIR